MSLHAHCAHPGTSSHTKEQQKFYLLLVLSVSTHYDVCFIVVLMVNLRSGQLVKIKLAFQPTLAQNSNFDNFCKK